MGRQRAENLNLHWNDISEDRWGDREQKTYKGIDRYQKYISEDRQGDREQRSYIGISRKREGKKGKEQEQRPE